MLVTSQVRRAVSRTQGPSHITMNCDDDNDNQTTGDLLIALETVIYGNQPGFFGGLYASRGDIRHSIINHPYFSHRQ